MKQYAGDYQKYMKQGGQGGEQSQSGDYQQGKSPSPVQLAAQPQGIGYQQYMQQYAGDDQKYTQGGQQAQGGDYQKYMKQYAGDYQKYMKQGGSNTTELAANFKKQYASPYMKEYASEYQLYMNRDSNKNMTQDEALREYAAGHVPKLKNASDSRQWGKAFMDEYGKQYEHYVDAQQKATSSADPKKASDCHNLTELRAWRSSELDRIQTWVPADYQAPSKAAVEDSFDSNKERIHKEKAAAASAANSSHTSGTANNAQNSPKQAPEPANDATAVSHNSYSEAAKEKKATVPANDAKAGSHNSEAAEEKKPTESANLAKDAKSTSHNSEAAEDKKPHSGSAHTQSAQAAKQESGPSSAMNTRSQATPAAKDDLATEVLAEQTTATVPSAALAAFVVLGTLAGAAVFVSRRQQPVTADGYLNLLGEP